MRLRVVRVCFVLDNRVFGLLTLPFDSPPSFSSSILILCFLPRVNGDDEEEGADAPEDREHGGDRKLMASESSSASANTCVTLSVLEERIGGA